MREAKESTASFFDTSSACRAAATSIDPACAALLTKAVASVGGTEASVVPESTAASTMAAKEPRWINRYICNLPIRHASDPSSGCAPISRHHPEPSSPVGCLLLSQHH